MEKEMEKILQEKAFNKNYTLEIRDNIIEPPNNKLPSIVVTVYTLINNTTQEKFSCSCPPETLSDIISQL